MGTRSSSAFPSEILAPTAERRWWLEEPTLHTIGVAFFLLYIWKIGSLHVSFPTVMILGFFRRSISFYYLHKATGAQQEKAGQRGAVRNTIFNPKHHQGSLVGVCHSRSPSVHQSPLCVRIYTGNRSFPQSSAPTKGAVLGAVVE